MRRSGESSGSQCLSRGNRCWPSSSRPNQWTPTTAASPERPSVKHDVENYQLRMGVRNGDRSSTTSCGRNFSLSPNAWETTRTGGTMRAVPCSRNGGSLLRELRGPEARWGAGECVSPHSRSAFPGRVCKSLKELRKISVESRQVRIGRKLGRRRTPLMSAMGGKRTQWCGLPGLRSERTGAEGDPEDREQSDDEQKYRYDHCAVQPTHFRTTD
jgi:hypothetical protein